MEAKMDEILEKMATSKGVNELAEKLDGRLKKVEKNQGVFKKNQDDML